MQSKIHKIVLTGGCCSGKSTSLSHISERLKSLGFNVFVVPEVATFMILGGMNVKVQDPTAIMQTQSAMIEAQLALEKSFTKIAQLSDKPAVILLDRGTMDVCAFTPPHLWQPILDEHGWTLVELRDKNYDAVIHLVTAAIGAPEAYTLANNAARTETPEEAAAVDGRLKEAWIGHPHLRVIDNSTDFPEKIRKVLAAICNVVGIPEPMERERKFLILSKKESEVKSVIVDIEQTYLKSDKGIARVRKRGQSGSFTYTHTIKFPISPGKNVEYEKMISAKEYVSLLNEADSDRISIHKKRECFLWKDRYYELDVFISPFNNVSILELEFDEDNQEVEIPPWITIEKEVTDDPSYSNAEMAKKKL